MSIVAGSKAHGLGKENSNAVEVLVVPPLELELEPGPGSGLPALSMIPSPAPRGSSTPLGVDWALKSRSRATTVPLDPEGEGGYSIPLSMPSKLRLSRMLRYSAPTMALTLSHLRSR